MTAIQSLGKEVTKIFGFFTKHMLTYSSVYVKSIVRDDLDDPNIWQEGACTMVWIVCYHRKNQPKVEISVCQRCRYLRRCNEFKNAVESRHLELKTIHREGKRLSGSRDVKDGPSPQ